MRRYKEEHLHSSIRFVTPSDRHEGYEAGILEAHAEVYQQAKARHPQRWPGETREWSAVASVTLNPAPNREVRTSE